MRWLFRPSDTFYTVQYIDGLGYKKVQYHREKKSNGGLYPGLERTIENFFFLLTFKTEIAFCLYRDYGNLGESIKISPSRQILDKLKNNFRSFISILDEM